MANIPLQSITFPGLSDKYTTPVVDNTLAVAGAAADAKKTGDEISGLKNDFTQLEDKVEDAYNAYVTETETGSIASFSDGADGVPVKDLIVAIEPVQSGSGDPSPENVRPISGWTGANVTRTGKNLYEGVQEINSTPFDPVLKYNVNIPETCTFQFTASSDYVNTDNYWLVYLELQDGTKSYVAPTAGQTVTKIVNGTEQNPLKTIYVRSVGITAGHVYNLQLEVGSTASTYEPYQGDTYEINWQSSAGTVYGGTLDVTTGVLTVDRGYIASYNGETLPSTWISDRDVYASGTTPTTGAQVVYALASPQTYQLTPQEVSTILGQNNIFADCGDSTVQYRADTKLYIDKVLSA